MENFTKILSLVLLCLFVSFLIAQYQERPMDTEIYYNIANSESVYSSPLTTIILKTTGFLSFNQFLFAWIFFFHLAFLSIFGFVFNRFDLVFLSSFTSGFMILSFAFGQMLCLLFLILSILEFQRKSSWWVFFSILAIISHRLGFFLILVMLVAFGLSKLFKEKGFSLMVGMAMFSLMGVSIGFSSEIYIFAKGYYDIFTHCLIIIPMLYFFFSKEDMMFWKLLMLLLAAGSVILPIFISFDTIQAVPYILWRTFGMFDLLLLVALAETKTKIDDFLFGFLFLMMAVKMAIGVV